MKEISGRIFAIFLAIILSVICICPGFEASASTLEGNQKSFEVDFIDVGQGDAALVVCDGHYMLIDGGKADRSSLIYSYLKQRKISYLDYIVASHPDADHIGGLSGALNYASVGKAFCPVQTHDTKTFASFTKYLAKQNVSITVPKAGDEYLLGSAKVVVLAPRKISGDSNNDSIVMRIIYGNTSFLFTGDAEREEESDILSSWKNIKSTVIKIGHHGSAYSTSYYFLRQVDPSYAVISVGDNSYGHPTEETLSRLRDAEVTTYRTDMQGTIVCYSDGKKVTFNTARNISANTLAGAGIGQNSSSPPTSQKIQNTTATYILNTNTKKFHYPTCASVSQMKEKNKKEAFGTRDEIIAQGFVPCKNCNP